MRSCRNYIGQGRDWYHCAVRSPAENDTLIEALQSFLEGIR